MNGCLNRPADQKICFEYCPLMANCLAIMTLITVTAGVSLWYVDLPEDGFYR
jgi:hypothetical protein